MPDLSNFRIDKAMTRYAQGLTNGVFGAERIFPEIPVDGQTGIYYIFDTTRDLLRDEDDLRAPGTKANLVDYDSTQATFITEDRALDFLIADETIDNNNSPFQLVQQGSRTIDTKLRLGREIRAAALMLAGVTNTSAIGGGGWNDPDNSDIMANVTTARQSVRDNTFGREANRCLMDAVVWDAVKEHNQILSRVLAGGNNRGPAKLMKEAVAELFEVDELIVVSGYKNTANEGQTAAVSAIWSDDVYFWHQSPTPSLQDPSFAYSITWKPTRFLRARDTMTESERLRQGRHYTDRIVAATAAYRLSNAIQ